MLLAAMLLRPCAAADLLLWEFMPDPAQVDDAAGEWLELYNPGTDSVKLAGWSFATGSSGRISLDSGAVLPPGGFWTVARTGSDQNGGFVAGQILSNGWSLPNGAGSLRLWNPAGQQRDSVTWGSGWSLRSGRSLERIGAACDGGSAACWQAGNLRYGAGDYGTPGARNSQDTTRQALEGAVVAMRLRNDAVEARVWNRGVQDWNQRDLTWWAGSEIRQKLSCASGDTCAVSLALAGLPVGDRLRVRLALPADARPADDTAGIWLTGEAGNVILSEIQASSVKGQPEWIELSQGMAVPLDLAGWSLGDTLQVHPFAAGTILPAGGNLVLSPDCDGLRSAWALPAMPCAEVAGWPRLSQVEDLVLLRDEHGNVRDSLAWSTAFWGSWPAGKSRERRSRSAPTQDASNWIASPDAMGATPGWAFGATPGWSASGSRELAFALDARLFCPGDAQVPAVLPIRLAAPPSWNLTISVYDLDRRRVRRLHQGAAPVSGRLEWDGRDDAGRPCRMGTYLLLLEAAGDGSSSVRREWAVLGRRL